MSSLSRPLDAMSGARVLCRGEVGYEAWWQATSRASPSSGRQAPAPPTKVANENRPLVTVGRSATDTVRVPARDPQGWPARRRCASLEVGLNLGVSALVFVSYTQQYVGNG